MEAGLCVNTWPCVSMCVLCVRGCCLSAAPARLGVVRCGFGFGGRPGVVVDVVSPGDLRGLLGMAAVYRRLRILFWGGGGGACPACGGEPCEGEGECGQQLRQ